MSSLFLIVFFLGGSMAEQSQVRRFKRQREAADHAVSKKKINVSWYSIISKLSDEKLNVYNEFIVNDAFVMDEDNKQKFLAWVTEQVYSNELFGQLLFQEMDILIKPGMWNQILKVVELKYHLDVVIKKCGNIWRYQEVNKMKRRQKIQKLAKIAITDTCLQLLLQDSMYEFERKIRKERNRNEERRIEVFKLARTYQETGLRAVATNGYDHKGKVVRIVDMTQNYIKVQINNDGEWVETCFFPQLSAEPCKFRAKCGVKHLLMFGTKVGAKDDEHIKWCVTPPLTRGEVSLAPDRSIEDIIAPSNNILFTQGQHQFCRTSKLVSEGYEFQCRNEKCAHFIQFNAWLGALGKRWMQLGWAIPLLQIVADYC